MAPNPSSIRIFTAPPALTTLVTPSVNIVNVAPEVLHVSITVPATLRCTDSCADQAFPVYS